MKKLMTQELFQKIKPDNGLFDSSFPIRLVSFDGKTLRYIIKDGRFFIGFELTLFLQNWERDSGMRVREELDDMLGWLKFEKKLKFSPSRSYLLFDINEYQQTDQPTYRRPPKVEEGDAF